MKRLFGHTSTIFFLAIMTFAAMIPIELQAQTKEKSTSATTKEVKKPVVKFGTASYYAGKFHGKKTASGETYRKELFTAASNTFPLNTWIKITNLVNNTSVIARINDRLHSKNKRLVDLSESAAKKLGYIESGVTDVEVKVLTDYHPGKSEGVN